MFHFYNNYYHLPPPLTVITITTISQVLSKERSHGTSSSKGQLNLYGSTEFVTQFTAHWQREGYCDYTTPPQAAELSGTHVSLFSVVL